MLIDGNFDIAIRPGMSLYDGTRKNHLFVSFVHVFLHPIIERPSVGWIFTTHIHQLAILNSKLTHDTRPTDFFKGVKIIRLTFCRDGDHVGKSKLQPPVKAFIEGRNGNVLL